MEPSETRKHGLRFLPGELEPFNSSDAFDGWSSPPRISSLPSAAIVERARTWLLNVRIDDAEEDGK